MSLQRISLTPYFGNDAAMPEGCCDRRKRGEEVPCCAPYSPAELDTFRKEREAAADQPAPVADVPKKKGNLITRFFKAIPEWFIGLFRGFFEDLQAIGRKLTGRGTKS